MTARPLILTCLALSLGGCALQPQPLSDIELSSYVNDKRTRLVAERLPLAGALTLNEALSRAIRYNLDKEIEVMQVLLAEQQLRVTHYSSLPGLVAGSGFTDRNNYAGGSSVRLLGPTTIGEESLSSSASSERRVRTSDIRFSWHILDFGLSYIRAKQAADKVLIAEETRRRVVNRIQENVRAAYWRAVAATRMMRKLATLETRVARALADSKSIANYGDTSPLTALTYERELVEIQREIRKLSAELSNAKAQLAALVNLDPGKPYEVAVPSRLLPSSGPKLTVEAMLSMALSNRSELREVAYQQRINAKDADAALLEMLPGLSLDATPAWNSNRFLYNNHWVAWGAQASWNLMKVFSYPDRRAEVEAKDAVLDARALAVTIAIMTQVHVARARIYHAAREFRTAEHYHDVQQRILDQIRNAASAGKVSEQTAIREEMNTLVAIVKRDMAFAELQSAEASLIASMGVVPDEAAARPTHVAAR